MTKTNKKPQADIVLQCKLDPIDNLRKLRHHCQYGDANEVLQGNKTQLSATGEVPVSSFEPNVLETFVATNGLHFNYLGDGGMTQDGLNVDSAKIRTAGHEHCGKNQHCESPPSGPVDNRMT